MSDLPSLRAELKKLSARAMQLKMDLHDLSEELPRNWELILPVAQKAHDAFAELHARRLALQQVEAG